MPKKFYTDAKIEGLIFGNCPKITADKIIARLNELKTELEQAREKNRVHWKTRKKLVKEIDILKEDISALAIFGKPDLTMGWPYYCQEEIYEIIKRAKARVG